MATGSGSIIWKTQLAMLMAPLIYGGYNVVTKVALNDGVNQLVFCVFRDLIALSVLAPVAYFHEKHMRPPITKKLLLSFFLLGSLGIFANQLLFLIGLKYTNATYAAATQPAIPVFTFLFSAIMGVEKVNLLRYEGWAKVGGTIICVFGALLMVFYRGPVVIGNEEIVMKNASQTEPSGWLIDGLQHIGFDQFSLGVMCLIGNCMCMGAYLAIQAPLLRKYPTNISLTAYSYFFGAVLMVIVSMFMTNGITDWTLTGSEILAVIYSGVIASALGYALITWSSKILGPTMVSLYISLQPACATILSLIFLGSAVYLGSILGGTFIIAGLYIVTWGSYRERQTEANDGVIPYEFCVSEPLIQKQPTF
ncbi:WAT1-related protein At4g19185 [Arachis ipaensis]|uniref:WAT1-related protein At4g19185 n=1 Tax=Arachis ipaensis TaxID=130454 RepID=UPI0007AF2D3B|nr:WAT1-related protein At4g19185 [Arachis ipaensis]